MKRAGFHAKRSTANVGHIAALLALCLALLMAGYTLAVPVFGAWLDAGGGGERELGLIILAFAAGQLVFAPLLGYAADRIGRKPLILTALAALAVANVAYLLFGTVTGIVVTRFLHGALTAGLMPAALAMVGDLASERERARQVGVVMGGYGLGIVIGPVLGGGLYDLSGFHAPFIASSALGVIALVVALWMVPETLAVRAEHDPDLHARFAIPELGVPSSLLAMLLVLDFLPIFALAWLEPQLVFYAYEVLGLRPGAFGLLMGGYGLAMAVSQVTLGMLSDRFGRRPVLISGFLLAAAFYLGLGVLTDFWALLALALVAGTGTALVTTALSATYLDVTPERTRSRVMGLKEMAVGAASVSGPATLVLLEGWLTAKQVFLGAAGLMVWGMLLASLVPVSARSSRASRATSTR